MEMGGDGWVETQTGCGHLVGQVKARQDQPSLSSRVAHHVIKLVVQRDLPAAAEEKAIAAVHESNVSIGGQEG